MSNVQAVERAFAILQTIATHPEGVGVTAIAKQVGLPKSTVFRILATLETLKAVERVSESNQEGYRVGPKLIDLVSQTPYAQHLGTIARPYLLELAETAGEAVGLAIPDGDQVYFVDQVPSQHYVQIRDWTDSRVPLHTSASGKVFLAYWSDEALGRYLMRPLPKFTQHTITDPQELRQELTQINEQGYAWSRDEFEEGLVAFAVPIEGTNEQVIGAVGIYGPSFRFPVEGQEHHLIELAQHTSQKISSHLDGALFE